MNFNKSRMEEALRERFFGSRLFPVARTGYQFLFNRNKLESRRRLRKFYSGFIRPGDLVFDVGANVGIYSEIFTELGASVIAIEPNPACSRLLKRLSRNRRVIIEECAVGEVPGKILLHLSDNHQLGSANPEWCKAVEQSELHRNASWVDEMEVDSTTLDLLAQRHGIPHFVKIDVEGFDDRALCGMSFTPHVLTFEFNRLMPAIAERCLESPALRTGYEFNFISAGTMECVASTWIPLNEFSQRLDFLAAGDPSGDVIARRAEGL